MMSLHPTASDLELYVMGNHEGLDVPELEAHLGDCRDCIAVVRREARLELGLLDVATQTIECPSCRRATASARCAACGAVLRAGEYRVISVVVQNAHGRLYLAEDGIGRHVALKELAFVQAPDFNALAAYEREVKFLRALEHPNIPRFVASFQEGEGVQTRLFLAQEYIDGESLQHRLSDHWFDEDEAVDTARSVLEILVYLQTLSPIVVHGDVKPANLIARRDGSIALVDFGAARSFNATITTAVGTFGYMPIEQLAGMVNPTTDLYGLGASLIHLLSREEPWRILEDPAALGRLNVSPELRRFLAKLTARRVQDRYPNARAALDALIRLRATRRRRMPWLAAASIVAALSTGAIGFAIAKLTTKASKAAAPRKVTITVDDAELASHPSHEPISVPPRTGDFIALARGDKSKPMMLANYTIERGVDRSTAQRVPSELTDVVQDPKTGRWYGIDDEVVGWFDEGLPFESLEENGPELISPSAIAFDSKRRRVIVAADGKDEGSDEGNDEADNHNALYTYEVDTHRWSYLADIWWHGSSPEIDSLAYSEDEDQLYGLTAGSVVTLRFDGKVVKLRKHLHVTNAPLVSHGGHVYVLEAGKAFSLEVQSFDFDVPEVCDADALKEKGMENVNMGQHGAALAQFEASLRCKRDPYLLQLAFMEACASSNAAKAKLYFKQLTLAQQNKFEQMCLRTNTAYR